jgi:hypothetical protein
MDGTHSHIATHDRPTAAEIGIDSNKQPKRVTKATTIGFN